MLPTDAVGILGFADEMDAGLDHRSAHIFESLDSERDDRAGDEEGMKFVGWTIELQHRTVAEPEPDQVIRLPRDRNAQDIPEHGDHFAQAIGADADKVQPRHRHVAPLTPPARPGTPRLSA